MPPSLLALFYRVAAPLAHVYWAMTRASPRGAKCLVTHGEQVLLVRHTYGNRRVWHVPGGLLRRDEEPEAGARRELREELGVEGLGRMRELCVRDVRFFGHIDRVHFFVVTLEQPTELTPRAGEIAEARWFPTRRPPAPLGREVREALALLESPNGKPGSPHMG